MKPHTWTLDSRLAEAERKVEEDEPSYQRRPTPDTLQQFQTSNNALDALERSVQADATHKFTNSINRQTSRVHVAPD